MAAARQALIATYRFFTHASEIGNYHSIQEHGIRRSMPAGFFPHELPAAVEQKIADDPLKIVCLWPCGSIAMNLWKPSPMFELALPAEKLPERVGLDWSHDSWSMACRLRKNAPERASIEIFLEVVMGTGSIASYVPIEPSKLLVCPKGVNARSDPVSWLPLIGTPKGSIALSYSGL
jgi:hypothetical protein